jgi:hypothetical protein
MRHDAMRSFTPYRLGRMECDAWVAYYRREWGRFLPASVGMVREGFGMDPVRTVYGAALVLRANQQWAPYPRNDAAGAYESMRRFYSLVTAATHETFDVTEAARLELAWWKVHRDVQRADGAAPELVEALAALSAHVYAVEASTVRPAAQLRADAMHVSDRWVADGCLLSSPLLVDELALLVRSYDALLAAVARGD